MNTNTVRIQKLVIAAVCLALCMVLPFLTGQIPEIGSMLCPMHIPVLLCGFLCGAGWGAAVGFTAPLLRHLIFSMPPMPGCISMAFELATYGLIVGVLHKRLGKGLKGIYGTANNLPKALTKGFNLRRHQFLC